MLSTSERKARARLGGLGRVARHDPVALARSGQAGLVARLQAEVLADAAERAEELSEAEVERRTEARRRLHFARLAFKSAKARRARSDRAPGLEASE